MSIVPIVAVDIFFPREGHKNAEIDVLVLKNTVKWQSQRPRPQKFGRQSS